MREAARSTAPNTLFAGIWSTVAPCRPTRDGFVMKPSLAILCVSCLAAAGCASNTLATSSSPATIQEQMTHVTSKAWGGPIFFRVGNVEMGYVVHGGGNTYTVNPGPTVMRVWYYGDQNGPRGIYTQTDPVTLSATLVPDGRYELEGWAPAQATTVRFSLVDLATGRTVASTGDVPLLVGPSRLAQSESRVPAAVRAALASAKSCCAGVKDFDYRPLPANETVEARIDTDSPAFAFPTGKSYFLAYALPQSTGTISLWVDSLIRGTVFFPRLMFLDGSFSPVLLRDTPEVQYVRASPTEAAHYDARCRIQPGDRARYLVILTTREDLDRVLELTRDVSWDLAGQLSSGDPDSKGSDAYYPDHPLDLGSNRSIPKVSLAGSLDAHDFAPTGSLMITTSSSG